MAKELVYWNRETGEVEDIGKLRLFCLQTTGKGDNVFFYADEVQIKENASPWYCGAAVHFKIAGTLVGECTFTAHLSEYNRILCDWVKLYTIPKIPSATEGPIAQDEPKAIAE